MATQSNVPDSLSSSNGNAKNYDLISVNHSSSLSITNLGSNNPSGFLSSQAHPNPLLGQLGLSRRVATMSSNRVHNVTSGYTTGGQVTEFVRERVFTVISRERISIPTNPSISLSLSTPSFPSTPDPSFLVRSEFSSSLIAQIPNPKPNHNINQPASPIRIPITEEKPLTEEKPPSPTHIPILEVKPPSPIRVHFPETNGGAKQVETPSQFDGNVVGKSGKVKDGSCSEPVAKKKRAVSNKNAPYICTKCCTVYEKSQSYAAHCLSHYRAEETKEERKQRLALKRNKKRSRDVLPKDGSIVPESAGAKAKKKKERQVVIIAKKEPDAEIVEKKESSVQRAMKNEPY